MKQSSKLASGGNMNSARQSIRQAPDAMVEDALMTINSWGTRLDGGGRMNSAIQSIHGTPNKILGWRIDEQR